MITVAAVQTNPLFGEIHNNCKRANELISSVSAHLFVLPELFNTGYLFEDRNQLISMAESYPNGPTTEFLANLSKKTNSVIAGGIAELSPEGKVYNSAVICDRGQPLVCYRKIHLFSTEKLIFDAGDLPPQVISSSIGRLGPMICFDWIFPETARTLALGGAQILVHCANLVMPYCQDAMVTRTIENRVFAVTANRIGTETQGGESLTFTGGSQITSLNGLRLGRGSLDREEVVITRIDPGLADDKLLNPMNHLFDDRRPGFYGKIVE